MFPQNDKAHICQRSRLARLRNDENVFEAIAKKCALTPNFGKYVL